MQELYVTLNSKYATQRNQHVILDDKDVTLNLIQGPFFSWMLSQAQHDVVGIRDDVALTNS